MAIVNYIRVKEVAKRLGVSKSTVWRWVDQKKLPTPLRPTKRVTLWREDDITEAVETLGAAS